MGPRRHGAFRVVLLALCGATALGCPRPDAERALRIEVQARQWVWEARYPGPDAAFSTREAPSADDVTVWSELMLPAGRPVELQVASADVVHAFYVPTLRVKLDAVPGRIGRVSFLAPEVGELELRCAQHCGSQHYQMRGKLTVLAAEDFRRWESEAAENARRAFDPEDASARWGWEWED